MARPLRIEYPGAMYHVVSRGIESGEIYRSDRDKERFLLYLENAYKRFKIIIHAYCLMPNHYHLVIETPHANLCRCMHLINSSYTAYYNKKHERSGHLFQGRYKAIVVDKDSYMQTLTRYVHLNPVKSKIVKFPEDYFWSSYKYFIFPSNAPTYLDTTFTLGFFNNNLKQYKKFTEEGLQINTEDLFKKIKIDLILGSDDFVRKIKNKYVKIEMQCTDLPSLRKLKKEIMSAEEIINYIGSEKISAKYKEKNIAAYLLRKYTDRTLEEIARLLFGKISSSAVHKIISRIEKRKEKDNQLNFIIKKLEKKVSNVQA